MNETVRRKLNSTETILKSMPALIEAFVTFYGESEREKITKKFNNMLVIGYSQPQSLSSLIITSNNEKSEEIINEFLNKLTKSEEEQEKLKKLFFKENKFEYYNSQPIYQYMKYKEGYNISEYEKNK